MTPKEMTALAREYAEQTDGSPADIAYVKAIAENALRFLLRRYCLVKKEVVRKEYNEARRAVREGHRERLDTMIVVNNSRRALLESLFPEIEKEAE